MAKIALFGCSGMLGTQLKDDLNRAGHELVIFVREAGDLHNAKTWNPETGELKREDLAGVDTVIHLGGVNIACRWNKKNKEKILKSRVDSTALIARTLAKMTDPPKSFFVASAIGFYGAHSDLNLIEGTVPGKGFLADVCKKWEKAADPAKQAGIRTVHLRFGVIIGDTGGMLKKQLPFFKIMLGGPVGSGKQFMSWISLMDASLAVRHLLDKEDIKGPINIVAQKPITNKEYTVALSKQVSMPAFLPMPQSAAKLVFGEMADETMLASQKVSSKRLQETGYVYKHLNIHEALKYYVKKD